MRSDGDLRDGAARKIQRDADGKGSELRYRVQHVRARRTASRADRKSRRSVDARRTATSADELPLFRGQHAGWTFFQCDAGGTQQECGEVSPAAGRFAGRSAPAQPEKETWKAAP